MRSEDLYTVNIFGILISLAIFCSTTCPACAYEATNYTEIEYLTIHNWTYENQSVYAYVPAHDNESYVVRYDYPPMNTKVNLVGMDLIQQLLILIAGCLVVIMLLMCIVVAVSLGNWLSARRRG